ncbi:tetratricopeptide repeat protein [Silanimonas sp.]|jgi:tetratricopeptide (TPR) repeat protein|uniref:tetratricopeptide repeat protein n=1 Tax=Silanimonas sp. TaxID=1929290 RepID=UPI0037CBD7BC
MSVINQMLRDLDARGQGDAASRHAAMASVGQPVGHHASSWRSRRLWWWVAAASVALALTAVLLVVNRWQAVERLAEAGVDSEAKGSAHPEAPVEATVVMPAAPQAASIVPGPAQVPTPTPVVAAQVETSPVEPPVVPSATSTAAAPPPSVPAPAARATIERIATVVDPLDAARVALAEGRADAALAALAVQPEAGAERDALEAAALQQLGRHAEAEQAYRRALRREPDVGAWWAGLGISLDTSGRGDEALDAFREAQRRGPLDPALADYLGERVEALSAGEPSR